MAGSCSSVSKMLKQKRHIAVIGDAMVDHWVHGHTELCQEGCLKFVETAHTVVSGGAANAENCLIKWGVTTDLHAYPHEDAPHKWRFVTNSGIVLRYDVDKVQTRLLRDYGKIHCSALKQIAEVDGVLLSDYDKGFLTPRFIQQVIQLCHIRGVPCVVDPKRASSLYPGAVIKGNLDWYLVHGSCDVVTRGEHQPLVRGKDLIDGELPPVKCVNHVGAGDCFAAHLTLALACGLSLEEAAAVAHSAGRVYVQHPHNRPPLPAEIEADMELISSATCAG